MGIADDYSGELPAAYVVLTAEAAQSIYRNAIVANYFSESISKVRDIIMLELFSFFFSFLVDNGF